MITAVAWRQVLKTEREHIKGQKQSVLLDEEMSRLRGPELGSERAPPVFDRLYERRSDHDEIKEVLLLP